MIRFSYTICDWLSTLFAFMSPITLVHWLLKIVDQPWGKPMVDFLEPLYAPLNMMVNGLLSLFPFIPQTVVFQESTIPVDQGVLAGLFTLLFFVFSATAEILRAVGQKVKVTKQAIKHNVRLAKLKQEKQQQDDTVLAYKALVACVKYDQQQNPTAANIFEATYPKYQGRILDLSPTEIVLQFNSFDHCAKYALDTQSQVLNYYQSLRPIDPQPPFHIGFHAIADESQSRDGMLACMQLINFARENTVVMSQDAKKLMDALGNSAAFKAQSIGVYNIQGIKNQEVFQLSS